MLLIFGQPFSLPALVGFISLAGIATRNGILLVEHYLNLIKTQGLSVQTLVQGGQDRAAPVVMTA